MDEVNPSITDEKLKAWIVAIYVTGLIIYHLSLVILQLLNLRYNRKPANK